jgi:hypothetical protein
MHRSGTSLLARMLQQSGIDFGPQDELLPATAANAMGYLEHRQFVELNDGILNQLGAGWDYVPALPEQWWDAEPFEPLKRRALSLIEGFNKRGPWGWKDPRNSITLPFWQSLVPDLQVVISVRNPLEVVGSLQRRNDVSFALGLNLWHTYYTILLQTTRPETRLVTHYDAYTRGNAQTELRRVLEFLSPSATDAHPERAGEVATFELRHLRFNMTHLHDIELSDDVVQLYALLCREAGGVDAPEGWVAEPPVVPVGSPARARATPPVQAGERIGRVSRAALDREALRQTVADLEGQLVVRGREVEERERSVTELRGQLAATEVRLAEARAGLEAGDRERAALQASIAALERQVAALNRRERAS